MKDKGFTLIELLGVIVILALIMILVFPNIINLLKNSRNEIDMETKTLIYNATNLYMKESSTNYKELKGATYCITLTDLVDNGYLKEPLTLSDDKTNIKDTKSVEVKYNNETKKFNYDLKDNSDCLVSQPYICEAVTETTKTVGKVPKGNYDLGDEYICDVNKNISYHFFVVSDTEEKVNLIMERNITDKGELADSNNLGYVEWASIQDYGSSDLKTDQGPITAMKYLNSATSSWSNIPNLEEYYTDEGENYGTILLNTKARLPKYSEMLDAGCDANTGTCPLWLVHYLSLDTSTCSLQTCLEKYKELNPDVTINITPIIGYWTLSSVENYNTQAHVVDRYADLAGSTADDNTNINVTNMIGVRPVISIPIKYIK